MPIELLSRSTHPAHCLRWALTAALVLAFCRTGFSDIVLNFTGDTTDVRGGGPNIEVLGVQNGFTGSVNWDGSGDVLLGSATQQSQTITVQDLFDLGVTIDDNGFDILYVVDETGGVGSTVNLSELGIFTRAPDGSNITGVDDMQGIFGIGELPQLFGGAADEGYIIDVVFTPDQWQLLLANPDNRIGMFALVLDDDNGPEEFLIRPSSLAAVPEPGSLLLCSLLAGATLVGRRFSSRRKTTTT